MRQYDRVSRRLVYLTGEASPDNWDERWSKFEYSKLFVPGKNSWLVNETKKFLNEGARVLEGGCGCGDKVYSLDQAGYKAFGFDTAVKALHRAKAECPELNLIASDIRHFPVADGTMDGYWSLGVFEHFEGGMEAQWAEAARVLRDRGFLFLTMPSLSPIRQLKAKLGIYPSLQSIPPGSFYQYAYSTEEVIRVASRHGFVLRSNRFFDGVKGLKDEVQILKEPLQHLYDSKTFLARLTRRLVDIALRSSCGHMAYFVFEKRHC
jgi:SAM-dependent methyltransferase